MSWKRARLQGRPAALLVAAAAALVLGCGPEVPSRAHTPAARLAGKRRDPADLFPADLDLVVRLDLGRMRAQLGPTATEALPARALDEADDKLLLDAFHRASVVWIGVRVADLDAGDRVVVAEGDVSDLEPEGDLFSLVDPPLADDVRAFDRKGRLPRARTARVLSFGGRTVAFVSPAELDSVARVLRDGPDAARRDPPAEGLLSADLRPRRLPPSLERRYPSIGTIIRGLERARGNAVLVDEGLRVEAEIMARSEASADRARDLILALRDGAAETRHAGLFAKMTVERVERTVHVRWVLPPETLRALVGGAGPVQRSP